MIDTHCHIDDPQYAENMDTFLAEQKAGGVECMLVPGVDASSIESVGMLADTYPDYLFPALGLHPENIRDDWEEQLEQIRTELFCPHRRYIAIGEIGLDYHWDTTYKTQQHTVLRTQMQWARELHLPVMIHSRDATEDTLSILREFPDVRGVFHCFSGSREVAKQVVDMGYYLGIGGVLTFKNCKLADHLSVVPFDRLLLETDAPYMAPVPHRGERNESRWMSYVAERLAYIYKVSPADIDRLTTTNAKTLFEL